MSYCWINSRPKPSSLYESLTSPIPFWVSIISRMKELNLCSTRAIAVIYIGLHILVEITNLRVVSISVPVSSSSQVGRRIYSDIQVISSIMNLADLRSLDPIYRPRILFSRKSKLEFSSAREETKFIIEDGERCLDCKRSLQRGNISRHDECLDCEEFLSRNSFTTRKHSSRSKELDRL